jgi:hypothetical protein
MRSLSKTAASWGLNSACINGVLVKETANSAPAVADTIAIPLIPTQNHSQRPDLEFLELFLFVEGFVWSSCAEVL